MNEQARKVFNIEEQKAKDLLAAIKTIAPVIPLIREWGKAERDYEDVCKSVNEASEKIRIIKDAIKVLSDEQIRETLSIELKKEYELHNQLHEKKIKFKQICDDFEHEVILYMNYAKQLAIWINREILEEVILPKLKTKNQYLSILFLAYNTDREIAFIKGYLAHKNFNPDILNNGWNYMLKTLKANEF